MDQRTVQREPLIYDWLRYTQQVNQENERMIMDGKPFWIPFQAIPTPIVNELFMLTDRLDLGPNTRYIALHLYDKFMCNTFWESYTNAISAGVHTTGTWCKRESKRILDQSKLRLMSCIQIASKVDSHSLGLKISQILSILDEIDDEHEYTQKTVSNSEFKVFKAVDFKLPSGTPLDCVEILISATGLEKTPKISEMIVHLLDLTYLQHHQLYTSLQFIMKGRSAQTDTERKNFRAMEINSLYVGASVVLCTALLYCWTKESIDILVTQLADFVDIDENDIRVAANVLFHMAVEIQNDED